MISTTHSVAASLTAQKITGGPTDDLSFRQQRTEWLRRRNASAITFQCHDQTRAADDSSASELTSKW